MVLHSVMLPVSELRLPLKTRRILRLHRDHLRHDVPRVHVNRANCHDFSSVAFVQFPAEYHYQSVQLTDLLSLVIFKRILEAFLQPHERHVHFRGPPYLTSA